MLATPTGSGPKVDHGADGVITFPTFLSPVLVWSQHNYLRLLKTERYFESS